MSGAPGDVAPALGRRTSTSLSGLGREELARRWQTARQRIRENGVTYNVYGDPLGMDRPWNLDAIPLLISPHEWRELEAGLIQRAQLLNWILADLYGPQKLLRGGDLPPASGLRESGFLAALSRHLPVPDDTYLHLLAVDLARSADGQWWVLSDRTQAPSGAGYALENRIVLAETFPDLFREFEVQRLARFSVRSATICCACRPRMRPQSARRAAHTGPLQRNLLRALLPGALSGLHAGAGRRSDGARQPRLSEDAGRPEAGGRDPAARGRRLLRSHRTALRFISGRRGSGGSGARGQRRGGECAGQRIDRIARTHAVPAGLSKRFLGEKLKLPSVATWWCGQPRRCEYVRENLDYLVIKPAFAAMSMEPVFGGKLAGDSASKLLDTMQARPYDYAGQELLHLSTAPVWSENTLTPAPCGAARFLAASGDSWVVMPGGLARVSPSLDTPVVSMQRGGGSKDTWVLSDGPVDTIHAAAPARYAGGS